MNIHNIAQNPLFRVLTGAAIGAAAGYLVGKLIAPILNHQFDIKDETTRNVTTKAGAAIGAIAAYRSLPTIRPTTNSISLGLTGLRVTSSSGDSVSLGLTGLHVEDRNGRSVSLSPFGISASSPSASSQRGAQISVTNSGYRQLIDGTGFSVRGPGGATINRIGNSYQISSHSAPLSVKVYPSGEVVRGTVVKVTNSVAELIQR